MGYMQLYQGLCGGAGAGLSCCVLFGAGGTLLTVIAPFVNIQFLGSSLTFMMVRDGAPAVR